MDNMTCKVSLVGMTQPSAITECHTANELIAYAARVSNPANQNNEKTASKLLRYLIKEGHWSPFEMVSVTMEIKTTRDISRQIIRHRSFAFQEFSQRYAVSEGFITNREARTQHPTNRQLSLAFDDDKQSTMQSKFNQLQQEVVSKAKDVYEMALNSGIAKEQARALLPEGLTKTTLYMSGTLRSWIHYCELRRGHGTQAEHIEVADKCWDVLGTHFPDVIKAVESLNERQES
jgi:thymidylate synthase (FAD)